MTCVGINRKLSKVSNSELITLNSLNFLHIYKPFIKTILYNQAVVCTPFYNFALLQNNDLISMANGAQPVSYNDRSAITHQVIDSILYQPLTFGIKRGSGFIQDQDRGI